MQLGIACAVRHVQLGMACAVRHVLHREHGNQAVDSMPSAKVWISTPKSLVQSLSTMREGPVQLGIAFSPSSITDVL